MTSYPIPTLNHPEKECNPLPTLHEGSGRPLWGGITNDSYNCHSVGPDTQTSWGTFQDSRVLAMGRHLSFIVMMWTSSNYVVFISRYASHISHKMKEWWRSFLYVRKNIWCFFFCARMKLLTPMQNGFNAHVRLICGKLQRTSPDRKVPIEIATYNNDR